MISVIVPVYNVEKYLERCVKSIVGQTFKDLEIILVDDGSTDLSGGVCDTLQMTDSRIKVIHKKNGGLSDARNCGIEIAKGEYIGFVDSDDWIAPDMYESLIEALLHHNASIAVTGIHRVYDNGFSVNQFVHETEICLENDDIVRKYLRQDFFSTSACDKIFKVELFNKTKFPVGKLYEDAPVIYGILKEVDKLVVVGKPQYNYFQRVNSICGQSFSRKKMDHFQFSKEIWKDAKRRYPKLSKEADIFWYCKVCELIYSIVESDNSTDFKSEINRLHRELKNVSMNTYINSNIPFIMRFKIFLANLHLEKCYYSLKNKIVIKG